MMRKLSAAILILLVSCSKRIEVEKKFNSSSTKEVQSCTFGLTHFNTVKRSFPGNSTAKKPASPIPGIASPVILLDFDGETVSGTAWNYNGDISCSPANLNTNEINEIVDRVTEDYRPFNVIVTTDENIYTAANPNKRMRAIISESWEWYGQAGGVAYINSFTWGDNTPCFVFSVLLNYNKKNIAEAVAHEVGHTLGLYHQCIYDLNCVFTSEYNCGMGAGEIGWAPIMGCGNYQNITTWYNGTNTAGCNSMQDDITRIGNILGFKNDDHSNIKTGATSLVDSAEGIINSISDIDFFITNLGVPSRVTVTPFNIGNNLGADLDVVMKIYDNAGKLLFVINDPLTVTASVVLSSGRYYISVEPTGNIYAPSYGMMGKYSIVVSLAN